MSKQQSLEKQDDLTERVKQKIIEIFGPESSLAQAMDDPEFFKKLDELVSWLYGEIARSIPPRVRDIPGVPMPPVEEPWPWQPGTASGPWIKKWERTGSDESAKWQTLLGKTVSKFTPEGGDLEERKL